MHILLDVSCGMLDSVHKWKNGKKVGITGATFWLGTGEAVFYVTSGRVVGKSHTRQSQHLLGKSR